MLNWNFIKLCMHFSCWIFAKTLRTLQNFVGLQQKSYNHYKKKVLKMHRCFGIIIFNCFNCFNCFNFREHNKNIMKAMKYILIEWFFVNWPLNDNKKKIINVFSFLILLLGAFEQINLFQGKNYFNSSKEN